MTDIKSRANVSAHSGEAEDLKFMDPKDDAAIAWITNNLSATRRDDEMLIYTLKDVVRAYQASPAHSGEREALERLREAVVELARAGSHLREFVRYHPEEGTCDIEASLYMVGRIVGQYTNEHPDVLDATRAAIEGTKP